MKKLIFLMVLLLANTSFAQTKEDSLKTAMKESKKLYKDYQKEGKKGEDFNLFSKRDKETKVSIYVAFDLSYQKLTDSIKFENNNQTLTAGLSVGAIFNKHFGIGVWGRTNTENMYREDINSYLRYGDGGLFMQLRIFPTIPIHFTIPIRAGFGTISYWDNDWALYGVRDDVMSDSYFIFEPGVNVEFNIVRYFKISGGVSYKWTDAIELYNSPNDILNGWCANVSLIINYK